jgi:V-type H+-transporting ATPase subunit H
LHKKVAVYQPLLAACTRQGACQYAADKSAWLLSSIMSNFPIFFSQAEVTGFVEALLRGSPCSDLGTLEAIVNLLKCDDFRRSVWELPGVAPIVTTVKVEGTPPPSLYKCVFSMWLLSFDAEGTIKLKVEVMAKKLREIVASCRVEKVIRLSLTVLKNFLGRSDFAEQVVELGVLELVQALEYEKWRDAELYDDIRELASAISLRVADMSNFDRYAKELHEGHLKWGFIHSPKFWADNVLKFEQNNYAPLKLLAGLLSSNDPVTLAVACHDIGEFVTNHPLGKKQISSLAVKERVMELMGSTNPDHREVRREALLCCQKIMLNKWQDMDNVPN